MASKKTPNKTKTIKPPILFSKTQELISKITKQLDAPLLAYWNSNGGSVCQNDVIVLSDILKYINKCDKIYFFIKSSGGSGQASLRIVHLLRQSFKNVIALLPLEAASAATMLCLGADEIQIRLHHLCFFPGRLQNGLRFLRVHAGRMCAQSGSFGNFGAGLCSSAGSGCAHFPCGDDGHG